MVSDKRHHSSHLFLTSLKSGIVKRNRRKPEKSERDKRKGLAGEILWPYSEVSPCGCKVCPCPLLELCTIAVSVKTPGTNTVKFKLISLVPFILCL